MFDLRFRGSYASAIAKEFDSLIGQFTDWLTVDHNEDGTHNLRPSGFDFVPIGAGMEWYSDTAPERWIFARGQALSRVTYAALFQLWGTAYGAGDGSTTFNAPNLERRMPIGKAASGSASTLAATGGDFDHTHSGGSHSHSISSDGGGSTSADGGHTHSVSGTTSTASTTFTAADPGSGANIYASDHTHTLTVSTDSQGSHSHTVSNHSHGGSTGSASGSTGSGNPPYLVINFIILAGV